jgi:predicted  nucleic acid-binding Zn-ribbon protein
MRIEDEDFKVPNAQRGSMFWPVAVVALAAGAGIAWLGFPYFSKIKSTTEPTVQVTAQTESDYYARLNSIEEKLSAWARDKVGIMDRIAQVEKSMSAGVRRARSEATAMVEGVKREMNQGMEMIQSRMAGIESAQHETEGQVAKLQEDLATARHDLEAAKQANTELSNHLTEIQQSQEFTQNQVSRMQNRMLESDNRVDAIAHQVDRRRVDFELNKNQADEVASGIHLTITKTDVARQQVDGWLQVAGRFIWLHDANAQRPIAFDSVGEERPYQLIFTRIGDTGATGYLLVPGAPVNTAASR